jgi:mannose-1-phosphate guanylyltransferase / mannose-6-phosphate isomerase
MLQPVIIAGGSGTRLWPLSRSGFPKQFLALGGTETLFQKACLRCKSIANDIKPLVVVTNEEHRFLAQEQLTEINSTSASLILEPIGRNTAPAMTLAALHAVADGDDPILFVTPSDQIIQDTDAFQIAARSAVQLAKNNAVVILGVLPTSAHIGYGYIKASGKVVDQFVEKPDLATAQHYLETGNYFWNAGIFVTKASVWLKAVEQFRPDLEVATRNAWDNKIIDDHFLWLDKVAYDAIPAESIDRAVIEHLPDSDIAINMVPLDAGWNDLGSWGAVWEVTPTNINGNALSGDIFTVDSNNNYVNASSRIVGLVGVEDIVVVETPDAVLVANKKCSQDVKKIVEQLKITGREESDLHRKVRRPWGWYDSIDEGERFKVKRINVSPGASLSLQKHHHRAEHWVVIKGTAEVTCGDNIFTLTENQSTYIPLGAVHRLSNPGETPLELIEVQTGEYLGEDDIVRFEDKYGR